MEPRLAISFYNLDDDNGEHTRGLTVKDLIVYMPNGERFALSCNDLGLVVTAVDEKSIDVVSRPSSNALIVKVWPR